MADKKTIITVIDALPLTDEQILELAGKKGIAAEDITIQRKSSTVEDYTAQYQNKVNALLNGAKFLIEHLPRDYLTSVQVKALEAYLKDITKEFTSKLAEIKLKQGDAPLTSLDKYQKALTNFSCQLVAGFASQLKIKESTAIKWLSKGEEYYTLTHPRPDLITLSQFGDNYLFQHEAQKEPLSEEQLSHYWAIHQEDKESYPEWYKAQDDVEKKMLKDILSTVESKEDIKGLFLNFTSRLRTAPGVPNFRTHGFIVFDRFLNEVMSLSRPAASIIATRDVSPSRTKIRDEHSRMNLEHILRSCAEEYVEKMLLDGVGTGLCEGEAINLKLPFHYQTLISPMMAAFLPDANLLRDKDKAMGAASEIKPIPVPKRIKLADGTEVNVTFNVTFDLNSTNHALNYGKYWIYTQATDDGCNAFADTIDRFIAEHPSHKSNTELTTLLSEYRNVLTKGSFLHAAFYDKKMRELYLSSLEQLMMVEIGIVIGSCVSAKDRKGLELLHTDAMALYHKLYGRFPSYSDEDDSEDRKRLVRIIAHLYLTGHHHRSAGLNADGAQGIKTPSIYLPVDVLEEIYGAYRASGGTMDDVLACHNGTAGNNELRSIVRSGGLTFDPAKTWLAYKAQADKDLQQKASVLRRTITSVRSLKKTDLEMAIDKYTTECLYLLKIFTQGTAPKNRDFWHANTSKISSSIYYHRPTHVVTIAEKLSNLLISESTIVDVYGIISRTLTKGSSRTSNTQKLYELISRLMFGRNTLASVQAIYNEYRAFYKVAMGEDAPEFGTAAIQANPAAVSTDTVKLLARSLSSVGGPLCVSSRVVDKEGISSPKSSEPQSPLDDMLASLVP